MKPLSIIKNTLLKINTLYEDVQSLKLQMGRIESRLLEKENDIAKAEFQVFSQWGEDGILQFIFNRIQKYPKIFVEFGVQDYIESNTRFLMINNYWDGLVIDGSEKNIETINKSSLYWKSRLKATQGFITKDNINELISSNGVTGEIGLLSIDIDGNDYWVWDAITCVNPFVVVAEYNSLWGPISPVSVPYDPNFVRSSAHYSHLYWGTSIAALTLLAQKKGYTLVTANMAGNNVFYVRNDLAHHFSKVSVTEVYQKPFFREARDEAGSLTYLNFNDSLKLIESLKLIDVTTMTEIKVKNLLNGHL